jgi:hypothetical protein
VDMVSAMVGVYVISCQCDKHDGHDISCLSTRTSCFGAKTM